jgi:hypothetical protein
MVGKDRRRGAKRREGDSNLAHYWHTSTKNERLLTSRSFRSCCSVVSYEVGTAGFGS